MARTSERSKPGAQKWDRLEALLDRYMTPALAEAGFRRTDGLYRVDAADGGLVLAEVRGSTTIPELTFFIEWAAIPRVLREFHSGGNDKIGPRLEWGIINTRLNAPHPMKTLPDHPDIETREFCLAPEPGLEALGDWDDRFLANERKKLLDFEAFGDHLDELLRQQAIPLWLNALDRRFLAGEQWRDYYLGGRTGIREAILFVDDGDPGQVSVWLDQAEQAASPPPDPPLVDPALTRWLRRRLSARLA